MFGDVFGIKRMGCASFYMTAGGEVSVRRIRVSQRRPLRMGCALLCGIATGDAVALAMTAGGRDLWREGFGGKAFGTSRASSPTGCVSVHLDTGGHMSRD